MAPKLNRKSAIISLTLVLLLLQTFIPQTITAASIGTNATLPIIQSPSGTTYSPTPTFEWTKISGATMYQYQLVKGKTNVFSKKVASSACGTTTCSIKPAIILKQGNYMWRVRAMVGGWKNYSAYTIFSVMAPQSPTPTQPAGTPSPTAVPTLAPATQTAEPTLAPVTPTPTVEPTTAPVTPTAEPTLAPVTPTPTVEPTTAPVTPTVEPTLTPVIPTPTVEPTTAPVTPTVEPTLAPVTPTPTAEPTPQATPIPDISGIHAIGLTYADYSTSRSVVPQIEQQLKTSGMNMVALNAGRVEWAYFKWAGHDAQVAGAVKDTGIDFLAQDAARFGQWAHVDAMIDVFAPSYIQAHPEKAAINAMGVASPYLVSTVEMVNGEFSQMLLSMVEYIAANYPVNSISLTELQYRVDGYGPDDTASYLAYTGRTDWPRQSNGQPAIDDPSIGNWRSYMIGTLLNKATAIAHRYGKQLFMDVTLNPSKLALMANNKGQNYNVMLANADRIVVWGYFAEDQYSPETFVAVGQFLSQLGQDRVILSIGLWGTNGQTALASDVKTAVESAQQGGLPNLWITPYTLTTTDLWTNLTQLWGA